MKVNVQWVESIEHNRQLIVITDDQNHDKTLEYIKNSELDVVIKKVANQVRIVTFESYESFKCIVVLDDTASREKHRHAGVEMWKWLRTNKIQDVQIVNTSKKSFATSFLEGLLLASYEFDKYKSDAKMTKPFDILLKNKGFAKNNIFSIVNLYIATCIARDLVNEPLSYLTAEQFSKDMAKIGRDADFTVETWDLKRIQEEKMGGILAVNKGSFDPPTYNILRYSPKTALNEKPLVLVGKGIVYDTGGLSLKPTKDSMDFMKSDMGGAASVVGAMYYASIQQLPLEIIGLIPCTDNRPGNRAYVPGDVVEMYSGLKVEVLNTDAEGRMVLADALHHAKTFDPALVLDFATLTGAAAAATGNKGICMMGKAPSKVKKAFVKAGKKTHERIFKFPMWEDFGQMIKSDIADIKNVGGAGAGMITAAKFLEKFVDYPWLHFDIAGYAFMHADDSYRLKGGTGAGVRLLADFFERYIDNIIEDIEEA